MPFLEQSRGITVKGGNFHDASVNVTNYTPKNGKGIKLLLESSLPQAIHNSSARDSFKCHPGTREEYIRDISGWGAGEWKARRARALWMRGPAGVGKSALAQTCAQRIQASGQLGASFFFYRPNSWNDPDKFIPTITYQLTTKYPAYRDLIDAIILRDRLVLQTSIEVQFEELLVKPLRELSSKGQRGVGMDAVIVIDGLDECNTATAIDAIIKLVITSIHQQTTPFLWAFFSRPEPHITSAFSSQLAMEVSWRLELPVSRDADSDVEAYLRDSFRTIHAKYGLPPTMTWPSEDDIHHLVDQSSGLFIYPVTIVRYIGQDNSAFGLDDRLRLVLELDEGIVGSDDNPLSALDRFYRLIMAQIPKADLPNTLSLLCIDLNWKSTWSENPIIQYCSILGPPITAFHAATSNLHSVIEIQKSKTGTPLWFSFYHKSFTEFLSTSMRSGPDYYVNASHCLQKCFGAMTDFLCRISNTGDVHIRVSPDKGVFKGDVRRTLSNLFSLLARNEVEMTEDIACQFSRINWGWLAAECDGVFTVEVEKFTEKVPPNWRSKIIHSPKPPDTTRRGRTLSYIKQRLHMGHKPEDADYIIGSGSKRALLVHAGSTHVLRHP